jgi:hypothetical protein
MQDTTLAASIWFGDFQSAAGYQPAPTRGNLISTWFVGQDGIVPPIEDRLAVI